MSKTLENKIDFMVLVSAQNCNPSGDPQNDNIPRVDSSGFGYLTPECIKRKIRNRMQDMGYNIFVQSDDRNNDGFNSLRARAEGCIEHYESPDEFSQQACGLWLDVRSFGQVFAYKASKPKKAKGKKGETSEEEVTDGSSGNGVSISIRGPVTIQQAFSVSPVEIEMIQITKSVNGEGEDPNKMSSDRIGRRNIVKFGLYVIKGSINVQLAEKTGFTEDDAEVLKLALMSLFEGDASSARPEGSMVVEKLFWWRHNSKLGQYAPAAVQRSVSISMKDPMKRIAIGIDDYEITVSNLEGLEPEIIDCAGYVPPM